MATVGFTDYLEKMLLDHIFSDVPTTNTYTPPTTLYLGLLSGTASDDAGGGLTEQVIGTGGYARVATTAADWSLASGTAPVVKTNTAVKTWPTATADWRAGANLTTVGVYDAATAGNLIATALLTTPKPVLNGDTPSLAASAISFKLGDVGDTY